MSDLPAVSSRFTTEATSGGTINGSYTAPANHSVRAFFNFSVDGSAGGAMVFFEVYIADSISGGTSTTWTREKMNQAHDETLQGTALRYTGNPTPSSAKLVETIAVPALGVGFSKVHRVPGGKVIYCRAICATSPTACHVTLNTDE